MRRFIMSYNLDKKNGRIARQTANTVFGVCGFAGYGWLEKWIIVKFLLISDQRISVIRNFV